ncbi:MAG: hypothetical protein KJ697_02690 [Nanoarchaeota archaeon]|nr:hypothetical protein [Nanoarchaeota archaeon]
MVEFETKEVKEIKFGNNKFLEVALKTAKTDEGQSDFVSISKGFMTQTGEKRFKNSLGFPAESEIRDRLVEALQGIL